MADNSNNTNNFANYRDDFEIGDVENYGNNSDSGFSHQVLVMRVMGKALENGSKEMKPGWFQNKTDKFGNMIRTYVDDTRKAFIESVESCLDIMECDIDDEAREEIDKIVEEVERIKQELISKEEGQWKLLNPMIRKRFAESGKGYIKGYLNKENVFYQEFLEKKLLLYRQILRSLTRLTKRLDYYAAEIVVG